MVVANRGFEFADEGLYALLSKPLQENQFRATNYDIIYKYADKWFGFSFDLQSLRMVRIAFNILGSICLFIGLNYLINDLSKKDSSKLDLLLFVIICGFCNYLPGTIQTPGYNAFHLFGIQLFAGGLLYLVFNKKASILGIIACSFLLGLGFFFCWLTKPTGTPIIVFAAAGLFYFFKENYRPKVIFICLAVNMIMVICFFSFSQFAERVSPFKYKEIFSVMNNNFSTHSMSILLKRISIDVILFSLSIGSGALAAFSLKQEKRSILYMMIFLFLSVLAVDVIRCYYSYSPVIPFYQLYIKSRIFVFFVLFITCVWGYFFFQLKENKKEVILMGSFFFVLTISYVFGSNSNNILLTIACLQFLWFAVWITLPKRHEQRYFTIIAIVLIATIWQGYFIKYSTSQQNVFDQKYKYVYGDQNQSVIYLDYTSFQNQNKLDEALSDIKTKYIVAYTRMPGNIYLAGKYSPGSFLWGEEDLNIYFKKRFTYPKQFVLLLEENKPEVLNKLKRYRLNFSKIITLNYAYGKLKKIYIYHCTLI